MSHLLVAYKGSAEEGKILLDLLYGEFGKSEVGDMAAFLEEADLKPLNKLHINGDGEAHDAMLFASMLRAIKQRYKYNCMLSKKNKILVFPYENYDLDFDGNYRDGESYLSELFKPEIFPHIMVNAFKDDNKKSDKVNELVYQYCLAINLKTSEKKHIDSFKGFIKLLKEVIAAEDNMKKYVLEFKETLHNDPVLIFGTDQGRRFLFDLAQKLTNLSLQNEEYIKVYERRASNMSHSLYRAGLIMSIESCK